MTDGHQYPGRPLQRHSVVGPPRDGDPRKSFGFQPTATAGHSRFGVGQRAQVPAYQGPPGMNPNNPDYQGDSPRESLASNRYPQSQKVYFPSAHDLRLGAQGYSSCSDRNKSDETISRSGLGADTYAGHLPSSNYGYGDQPSTKRSSKAYGMEHGHWLGMDGSIQNTTLQDTTCLKNLSRDEALNNYKNWSNQDIGDQSNAKAGRSDWLLLGAGQAAMNRSNQHLKTNHDAPLRAGPSLDGDSPLLPRHAAKRQSRDRRVPQAFYPPQQLYSAPGSTPLDETLQLMNQTQNKTIYQVTQSAQRRGPGGQASEYYKQVWTPRKDDSAVTNAPKRYNLTFKVRYKTDYGESLQVVGSIQELGAWKDYKCPLKWSEGHIWVSETMSIKSCSHFTYKYVVMFQDRAVKWERGPHRIADLVILPDVSRMQRPKEANSFSASPDSRHSGKRSHYSMGMHSTGLMPASTTGSRCSPHHQNVHSQATKNVELRDHWEQFTIRFSVFAAINTTQGAESGGQDGAKEYLRIIGSVPELTKSGTIESGPRRMKKAAKKFRWLYDKYGQEMCPWECQVTLKTSDFTEARELIYSYSKGDHAQRDYVYEREPSRIIKLQPPETYRGELGAQRSSQWRNWDKVWIVNGHVEKVDGNFLGELFCTKIGDTGICVGTYPLEDRDVQRLCQAGVTGVLNAMTLNDLRQRGVQLRSLQRSYDDRGMKCVKFPVNDIKEKDLQSNLFIAAQHLNNMVNGLGLNVYVHCTSGLSRAPAVVLAYLCLFKKIKCWQTPEEALKYIRTFNPNFNPNMRIIKKCLEANKEFQQSQPESQGQNRRLLDSLEDSFYFPNMIIEESHHNPMKLERLLDIANQIQEEEESFDTNKGPDMHGDPESVASPIPGPLQTPVDLSVIKPTAPSAQIRAMTSPRVQTSAGNPPPATEPPIADFHTPPPNTKAGGSTRPGGVPGLDEQQLQSKIDEEVALKLSQQLDHLRQKIIEEQEEKMRQAIQVAIQQSGANMPQPTASYNPTAATVDNTLEESRDQQNRKIDDYATATRQKEHEESQKRALLEEREAERAREAKDAEERRIRELEKQIEEMKKREDLFLAKLNEKEQKEREERDAREAAIREMEKKKEIEEMRKREEQARLEAEEMTRRVRQEMEQKMKEDIQRLMEEQMRQSKRQEEEQRLRELKIQKEKQDIEELLRKQQREEEQRKEEKILRKKQKQEERERQHEEFEAEKKELSRQLQLQQQEIQRLQASLHHDAERIKAFERLEESHQSLNRLEYARREAAQQQALSAVEELRKELHDQQEQQRMMEAQTAEQLRQKDELLRRVEQAKEQDLRREAEARLRQEQLLKVEMESKVAAEQLAEQQRRAMQELQLRLEREQEEAAAARLLEQKTAQEKELELLRAVEEEKKKVRRAAAEVQPRRETEEDRQPTGGERSASLYYQATLSAEREQSPRDLPDAQEPSLPDPSQQVIVKKRRDRRNRERSGNRTGQSMTLVSSPPHLDSDSASPTTVPPTGTALVTGQLPPQELSPAACPAQPAAASSGKSSLTLLAEEEQLYAAERLQRIKKKKEENAQRQVVPSEVQPREDDQDQAIWGQTANVAHQQQLDELRRLRDAEKKMLEETTRQIQQEQLRVALKAVADLYLQDVVVEEVRRLCLNRIEVETEVQNVLKLREEEVSSQGQLERSMASAKKDRWRNDDGKDQHIKVETEADLNESSRMREEEIQRLRNLRMLEEEKLNLLRLASEVEDQKSILKCKQEATEITLNETLAAQVRDIPEPRIMVGQSKREPRAVEDESLQLDYQGERAEDLYGVQEKQVEYYTSKSGTQSYGNYQANGRGHHEASVQEDRSMTDTRTINNSRAYNPADRSSVHHHTPQRGGQDRPTFAPYQANTLDLTDLQFEQMCDEYFANGPPIKFRPRRGVKLDEQIQKILKKERNALPVIHVRAALYLIGTQKFICEAKGELVMVRPQGAPTAPPQRLQKYLAENQKVQQQNLCQLMLDTKLPIEDVCADLVKGLKPGEDSRAVVHQSSKALPHLPTSTTPQSSKKITFGRPGNQPTHAPDSRTAGSLRQSEQNLSGSASRGNPSWTRQAPGVAKAPPDIHQRRGPIVPRKQATHGRSDQRAGELGEPIEQRTAIAPRQSGAALQQSWDPKKSPTRQLKPGKPTHVAPIKQLSLALEPGALASIDSGRQTGQNKRIQGLHGARASCIPVFEAGERSTRSQDAPGATSFSAARPRSKQQMPVTATVYKGADPSHQQRIDKGHNKSLSNNNAAHFQTQKRAMAHIPGGQIQLGESDPRASSLKSQGRRSPRGQKAPKTSAAKALRQKVHGRSDAEGLQAIQAAEAAEREYGYPGQLRQPEEVMRTCGDYSFRSNLDLFQRKYSESGVVPDQPSQMSAAGDADESKNVNASQIAQMGYLNALNQMTTTKHGR